MNKSAAGPVLGIVTPPRHVFILEKEKERRQKAGF
jgi:hypothetical protein